MSNFRSIDIDFEVHKVIEANRRSFSETPNEVLRRLFDISAAPTDDTANRKPYTYHSMELPHGTEARFTYNNVEYSARIEDGFWITENGERHKSPSGAASALAVTREGGKTKLDGWSYWHVRKPGSTDWLQINDLWKASRKPWNG